MEKITETEKKYLDFYLDLYENLSTEHFTRLTLNHFCKKHGVSATSGSLAVKKGLIQKNIHTPKTRPEYKWISIRPNLKTVRAVLKLFKNQYKESLENIYMELSESDYIEVLSKIYLKDDYFGYMELKDKIVNTYNDFFNSNINDTKAYMIVKHAKNKGILVQKSKSLPYFF